MNNLRTRNGEPNNFEDGLAVRGILLDGSEGAKVVAMKIQETDPVPTSLFDWVRATMLSLKTLSDAGGGKVADQPLTDSSDKAANTKFVQLLAAEMLLKIAGGTNLPVGLDSLAEFATAMGNDPQFLTKINEALATKVSIEDLRYTTANSCVAGGGPNAISGAFIPAIKTLVGEPVIYVRSLGANTVPDPTFTPNLGVISADVIVKSNNQPLLPGDIPGANYPMMLRRDSSLQKWVLMNPAGASNLPWASNDVTTAGLSTSTVVTPASLKATLAQVLGTAPDVLNSFAEIAAALKNDPHAIDTILAKIATLAPTQSPVFTDSPKAPTQPLTSNDATLATTAFVWAAITQALTNNLKASTQTISGIVRLCTNPEVLAMLNDTAAVTPATLRYWFDNLPAATTTERSIVRFASSDESFTGLLEDVAVNPKGMRFAIDQALSQFVGGLTAPTTPALTGSSTVVVGLSYTLTLTSQPTTGGATVTSFDLTLNNGAVQTLPATAGSATYTWTSSGTVGQTVTFRVKAKDSNNKVSAEASKVVTLSTITVNPVVVVSPTADQLARPLVGTFVVNAISFSGGTSAHLNTDWDLRTAANGGGTSVWSSLNDAVNKTSIAYSLASVVTPGTKYYLRVRQKTQNYGDSGWTEVGFTYIARPGAPTLSGAGSVISGQTYTLAMSSSSLETGATASQFLISVNGGAEVQITATSNSGTYTWTSSGVAGTTASLAVRVKDSNGLYSDPSTKTVSLTTVSINTPTFISPANGATGVSVSPTLTASNMATTGGADTFANADWEARTASGGGGTLLWSSPADAVNKTTITIPVGKLGSNALVYFRVRHRGAVYGVSDWAEISVTTMGAPGAPALSGAAGFRPGDNYTLTMSANPVSPATAITSFSVVVGAAAPVVVPAVSNSANWTYLGTSNSSIAPGQTVTISVTALDNASLVSAAGTKTLTSSKPNVPTYSGATTGLSISPSFAVSAMTMAGLASTHLSSDWELRTAPSGAGTLAASVYDSTTAKTAWTPTAASMANGTTYYLRNRQKSQDFGASDWMEIPVTTAAKPASATLSGANTHYLGQPYSLTVTASATSPATSIVSFDVVVDGGAPTTIPATLSAGVYTGTYVWPVSAMTNKVAGQTAVFSVTLKDNTGAVSNPASKSVGIASAAIATPSFIYPSASQTGLGLTFTATASDFSISGGGAVHASTDWKIVKQSDNVTTIEELGQTGTKLKTYSVPPGFLAPNTTYILQVKYNSDTSGSSAWGQVVFTTAPAGAPSIVSPTNGQVGVILNVVAYSSTFSSSGGNTHAKSSWELRTAANGGGVLVASLADSATSLTQWTISVGLSPSIQYYLRVKYTGSLSGDSAWGESTFVTGTAEAPVISTPANNATKVILTPTFTIADLVALVSGDTHLKTEWEVRTAAAGAGTLVTSGTTTATSLKSWTTPNLTSVNTVFYMRVRIQTQMFGYSNWTEIKFTTGYIAAPTIQAPTSGATGLLPKTLTISLAPFSAQGVDTHASTTYAIHTAANQGGSLVKEFTSPTALLGTTLSNFDIGGVIGNLANGTTYWLSVAMTGAVFGKSAWTNIAFTTGTPSDLTWVNPATDLMTNFPTMGPSQVQPQAPNGTADTVDLYEVTYGILPPRGGTPSITVTDTSLLPNYTPAEGAIQQSRMYEIRYRAKYAQYGYTNWISRQVTMASITLPVFSTPTAGTISTATPTLSIPAGVSSYPGSTHTKTDWEIRTQASGAGSPIWTSPNDAVNKTSITVPAGVMVDGTQYYIRSRVYMTSMGWSAWGEVIVTTSLIAAGATTQWSGAIADASHGFSTALDDLGQYLLMGAPHQDGVTANEGAAKITYRATLGTTGFSFQKDFTNPGASANGGLYGSSVDLDSTATRAVIGCPLGLVVYGAEGFVEVWVRSGTAWTKEATLKASTPMGYEYFGNDVSISADGSVIAVGCRAYNHTSDNVGAVYIFQRTGTSWAQTALLMASDWSSNAEFGISVDLSDDGSVLVVGAHLANTANGWGSGAAYVFRKTSGSWVEEAKILPATVTGSNYTGCDVTISGNGTTIAIGAFYQATTGSAYVYTVSGSTWTQQARLVSGANDGHFGNSLSLSNDGNVLAVGNSTAGAAPTVGAGYVFKRAGTVWSLDRTIKYPTSSLDAGYSCNLSGDGNYVAVGSPNQGTGGQFGMIRVVKT